MKRHFWTVTLVQLRLMSHAGIIQSQRDPSPDLILDLTFYGLRIKRDTSRSQRRPHMCPKRALGAATAARPMTQRERETEGQSLTSTRVRRVADTMRFPPMKKCCVYILIPLNIAGTSIAMKHHRHNIQDLMMNDRLEFW